jgi:hypothetical protein
VTGAAATVVVSTAAVTTGGAGGTVAGGGAGTGAGGAGGTGAGGATTSDRIQKIIQFCAKIIHLNFIVLIPVGVTHEVVAKQAGGGLTACG